MRNAFLFVSALLVLFSASLEIAQAQAFGVSWGYTRSYWDGKWYKDGYAEAGTGGVMLALRREMPVAANTFVAPYVSLMWMRHTTTTLLEPVVIVAETDSVISGGHLATQTHRTYFREWDLGFNVLRYLTTESPIFYLGGGPLVRWGQAGKREVDDDPPGEIHKAAWFGLTLLAGYRTEVDGKTTFFEPQLTFSPDQADRWQETYPPVNLTIQMGVLW